MKVNTDGIEMDFHDLGPPDLFEIEEEWKVSFSICDEFEMDSKSSILAGHELSISEASTSVVNN